MLIVGVTGVVVGLGVFWLLFDFGGVLGVLGVGMFRLVPGWVRGEGTWPASGEGQGAALASGWLCCWGCLGRGPCIGGGEARGRPFSSTPARGVDPGGVWRRGKTSAKNDGSGSLRSPPMT